MIVSQITESVAIIRQVRKIGTYYHHGNISRLCLQSTTLHFVVLSFDRYSRDDVIGEVLCPMSSVDLPEQDLTCELSREITPRSIKVSQGHLRALVFINGESERQDFTLGWDKKFRTNIGKFLSCYIASSDYHSESVFRHNKIDSYSANHFFKSNAEFVRVINMSSMYPVRGYVWRQRYSQREGMDIINMRYTLPLAELSHG